MTPNWPEGYEPISSLSIRELVDSIVDVGRGNARARLMGLKQELEQAVARATDEQARARNQQDLAFVEGYLETPASQIADIKAGRKGRK